MADFQTDYSGMAGAGSAFNSFATAFQDAQDRQVKQQEIKARMQAMQAQMERETQQSAIERRKNHMNQDGSLAPLDQEQRGEQMLAAGEKGQKIQTDPDTGYITSTSYDPSSPQMTAARNAGTKFQIGEQDKHNTRWSQYAEKMNDPTSRALVGKYQTNVDKAQTLEQLANQIGMPEGQNPPPNETPQQKVERFNKADPRQLYEFAKSADQLTSNAVGSVYGTDHLMPKDMDISMSKIREYMPIWAGGGKPADANAGAFVARYLDSAHRENKYFVQQMKSAKDGLSRGFSDLQGLDPQKFEDIRSGRFSGPPPQQEGAQFGAGNLDPSGLHRMGSKSGAPPAQQTNANQDPTDDKSADLSKMSNDQLKVWLSKHATGK